MWTEENELAAVAIERQEFWGATQVAMSGKALKDGAKPPDGIQITHPDRRKANAAVDKPKALTAREIAARMGMG